MWNIKVFANHQDLLAWLNNEEVISIVQNVQIVKADHSAYYEVFYWDNRILKYKGK